MKIFITGIGGISAAGKNITEHLESFRLMQRNAGQVSLFDTSLSYPVFEVKSPLINKKINKQKNEMRTLSLAMFALKEALHDAGLQKDFSGIKTGVCLGTSVASQLNDIDFYRTYRNTGAADMASVDRFLKGNLAEAIAQSIKAYGPSITVVNACSSGADAIGVALSWLRNGACDIAIAGGADELNRVPLCGFGALGILSKSLCSPFDRDRSGLNLGEGAGILILETEEFSRVRGKKPALCLAGYGAAADAYHLTAPRPDGSGLESALHKSLADANISPKDVCFVNAHGTATHDNDKVEAIVLEKIFGPKIKFLSTKGYTGHTLGAAGGLEAAFTASALREYWIPASAGFIQQDENIPIKPITEQTQINGGFAVSTSLAFGGNNASIVIAKERG
ncbi:MAG: beta-ketoacyl-[acyl-carrier-protein] synthase family protein [Deltaproteobacteria bacterium]|nr:beta-ketoacyl-[acyl-carrier-protein] synthase family protein [Deltaproteobacteria bacterium]